MITVKKLAAALQKRLGRTPEEALEDARTVMNYFGFHDTIIDNAIEPADRKLFYALQEAGLLRSYWETVPLLDGRHWRIFYWQLDEKTLERLAEDEGLRRRMAAAARARGGRFDGSAFYRRIGLMYREAVAREGRAAAGPVDMFER